MIDEGNECKWVSVKDRLPDPDQPCWVYSDKEGATSLSIDYYTPEMGWELYQCMAEGEFTEPTHWWPISEPPCLPDGPYGADCTVDSDDVPA